MHSPEAMISHNSSAESLLPFIEREGSLTNINIVATIKLNEVFFDDHRMRSTFQTNKSQHTLINILFASLQRHDIT